MNKASTTSSMLEIQNMLETSSDYEFLRSDSNLGDNIVFIGLGGSHAYGMANENSDLDLRGIALNTKEEILLGKDFEQVVDTNTDTTIYSLNKMVNLLLNSNPNTIEILGLDCASQVVYADMWFLKELYGIKDAFLSKKCINSFGGYANSQIRRMSNKAARELSEDERLQHIINSIKFAEIDFKTKFKDLPDGSFKLYVDDAITEGHTSEIFIDCNVTHYPMKDFCGYANSYNSIVRTYEKFDSRRNKRAASRDKISKHMAHLLRLYYMCFDILEHHEIITYREKEHDLLMDIRNDKYIDENKQPTEKFFRLVDEAEEKLNLLSKTTTLPEEPDYERVYKWLASVNERIVTSSKQ